MQLDYTLFIFKHASQIPVNYSQHVVFQSRIIFQVLAQRELTLKPLIFPEIYAII